MKIKILIENCETIQDFYTHLAELQRQIKKETRRLKLDHVKDEFKNKDVNLDDANCYGEHYVQIIRERI